MGSCFSCLKPPKNKKLKRRKAKSAVDRIKVDVQRSTPPSSSISIHHAGKADSLLPTRPTAAKQEKKTGLEDQSCSSPSPSSGLLPPLSPSPLWSRASSLSSLHLSSLFSSPSPSPVHLPALVLQELTPPAGSPSSAGSSVTQDQSSSASPESALLENILIQDLAASGEGNMTLQQSSMSLDSKKHQADQMSIFKRRVLQVQRDQGEGKDMIKLLGLPNIGNTCFLNATLQCLFALPAFSVNIARQEEIWGSAASSVLLRCFHELQAARNSSIKKKILYRVKSCLAQYNDGYMEDHEQDAHELLVFVLCQLKAEGQFLQDFICPVASLEFDMLIERTCCRCGEKVYREEPFNFLSLELTPCLKKSLDLYFKPADVECRCQLCLGEQASVVSKLLTLPQILVVHMKRFSFKRGKLVKGNGNMAIPGILPLSSLSVFGDETSKPNCHRMRSNDTTAALSCSTASVTNNQTEGTGAPHVRDNPDTRVYRLSGIVCHLGASMNSGHYISRVTDVQGDGWLTLDGTRVRRTDEATVRRDCESEAYILFYSLSYSSGEG